MNGREWIVEAFGCSAERLCDLHTMKKLFDAMISELALNPVGEAQWHSFPFPGGITGVCILAESHLTVHTFPEHESLCLNLFCCTERARWDFGEKLREHVGAERVIVRVLEREYVSPEVSVRAK
ncbi:MAG: S-adenosylmethionine decarboxylase [Gemmatimonadaceae bacterium]